MVLRIDKYRSDRTQTVVPPLPTPLWLSSNRALEPSDLEIPHLGDGANNIAQFSNLPED